MINVKTRWKHYGELVKKHEAYLAVEKNTSGSRPKELFEDMIEDMEKEYDAAKVGDACAVCTLFGMYAGTVPTCWF